VPSGFYSANGFDSLPLPEASGGKVLHRQLSGTAKSTGKENNNSNLTLPFTSCMALNNVLNPSGPQFPYLCHVKKKL